MTVKGIGNDLVEIQRIARSLERYGERFAKRILSPNEFDSFLESNRPDNFLAKRFAVKEAVSKALGTGVSQGITWHDIELAHSVSGQPVAVLHQKAKLKMEEMGAETIHISLSDEAGLVSAFAVLS